MVFSDYEAYVSSIGDADLRNMLLRCDIPRWSLARVALGDAIHVQLGFEGGSSITQGAIGQDGLGVYLQRSPEGSRANGEELGPNSVFLMPGGSEFCLADRGSHHWASVFVSNEVAAAWKLPTRGGPRVLKVAGKAGALWHLIGRLIEASEVEPAVTLEGASTAALEGSLLSRLEAVLGSRVDGASRRAGRPRVVDRRLVSSAVDVIESDPSRVGTVRDLVSVTGVPPRTLRDGFRKYLGVSPSMYIQRSRLNEARRRLAHPLHDKVTVARVAASVGMWDFGRFAKRYREAFGELPSKTLQRAMR